MKDKVAEKASSLKEKAVSKFEELKSKVKEKFEGMKKDSTDSMSGIEKNSTNSWTNVNRSTSSVLESMNLAAGRNLGNISTKFLTNMNSSKSSVNNSMSDIGARFTAGLAAALTTTSGKMGEIAKKFSSKMSEARDGVGSEIEKIKSKFDFKWSLPDLKLPHFSIDGKFSLNPPSVPSFKIKWYEKAEENAYLLKRATIFGSTPSGLLGGGEGEDEMIMGKNYMISMIQKASEKSNAETINAMYEIGNQMIGIMGKYLPECAKQKVAIPERTLSRSLRDMGVAFE